MELLHLIELDVDGRVARLCTWDPDQLHEALDELDETWPRIDPSPGVAGAADYVRNQGHAHLDGDMRRVKALITDDFVAVDHRPIGMGERSRSAWLSSTEGRF